MYKWMHMVQTHVIQRSTLICYTITLKIRCIPKCYRKLLCFLKRMYAKTKNDFSKLWYISFLPGLVIIAGIVFICLDYKEKKKKQAEVQQ